MCVLQAIDNLEKSDFIRMYFRCIPFSNSYSLVDFKYKSVCINNIKTKSFIQEKLGVKSAQQLLTRCISGKSRRSCSKAK